MAAGLMRCAPAGGSNAFIWASWAFLEAKLGAVAHARQLYDASTVADPKHAAAWHGWGLLEKKQGNLLRARDLWLKVRSASITTCIPSACNSSRNSGVCPLLRLVY